MDAISDLGLFVLFLAKALAYALAGCMIMGILDGASHIFWDGKVTKKQYLWALGASFLVGMFVQWQDTQHLSVTLVERADISGKNIQSLNKELGELRISLQDEKNANHELRRQNDLLSVKMETIGKESSGKLDHLRDQLNDKQREIVTIKSKLDRRDKLRNTQDQLGSMLAEGEQLKLRARRNVAEPPPLAQGGQWIERVNKFIDKEISHAHAVQFLNPPMLPSYSFGIPKDHEVMVNGMESHLTVLRQITKQLESDIRAGEH